MYKFLKKLLAVIFVCLSAGFVVQASVVKSEYASALPDNFLIGACDKQHKCGYININQEIKIPFEYSILSGNINKNGVAPVAKPVNGNYKDLDADEIYGIIDKSGKVLVDCKYYHIDDFYDGMAKVLSNNRKKNGKYGYFDTKGNLAIPMIYKVANRFINGRAIVSIDGKKYGIINKSGIAVVPLEYDNIWSFQSEYYAVRKNDKWGIIDTQGKLITPIQYSRIQKIHNGYVTLVLDTKAGILNCKTGKYVVEPKYFAGYISNSYNSMHNKYELCKTEKDGIQYCGMYNYDGTEIVPMKYKRVFYKGDELYELLTQDDSKLYKHPQNELQFLDRKNDIISVYEYKDGYLTASSTSPDCNGIGMLDKNGKWIVPPKYSDVHSIKEDMIRAEIDHRPCFYNKEGKLIVPLGYMFADDYKDGVTVVSKEGVLFLGEGVIDKNGKIRIPTKYQEVERIGNGLYIVITHALWNYGILDINNKTVIPIGKYSKLKSK